jgi:putative peptidoglycan lipid II flippase
VLDEQFVRWFGQLEQGATTALTFARQLNMVPVGVIAQAAGVAAYPFLARLAAGKDPHALARTTARAARNTVFIAAAASAVLVVLARPAVRLLYEYGKFTAADVDLVSSLLVIYAFSIPAWGLHQILSRHFYAKRKMWTVVVIGTIGTAVAIPTWLGLHALLGIPGFALASTVVMLAYALGLLAAWGRDSGWAEVRHLGFTMLRGVLAAGVAILIARPLIGALFGTGQLSVLAGLGAVVVGGLTALAGFLGVAYLLRAPELADVMHRKRAEVVPGPLENG